MDVSVSTLDMLRLGVKLLRHRVIQYRLGTNESVVRDTKYGKVRGLERKTLYDHLKYYAFEGIPYAQPPLGELRFRAPQPPCEWRGVRDCTYSRSKPLQRHFVLNRVEGSEDCLYLNVYAKSLDTPQKLPVMVWIYGGGFQIGEASRDIYSPDYFMQQNVILVELNYRLGALGFLSLKDRDLDVPGNAGLKDQVLALRWIKENIANFNGDPENITIFGESAGAASVHILMLTPQARGLFHKAIMQSGSALCGWTDTPDHRFGHRLAASIGYKGSDNDKEIFRYLSKANASDIAANCNSIITQEEQRDYLLFPFGPVIEPYVSEHCIVPKPYVEILDQAWGNSIPLIIGGTSFEGLFSFQKVRNDAEYLLNAFEPIIPRKIRKISTKQQISEMVNNLKQTYFEQDTVKSMEFFQCLHILSIKHFWHDMHRTILARLAYSQAPTYLYRFDMDSVHFNQYRNLTCGYDVRGVSHADDISYLFYNILASTLDKNTPEYRTIERMIAMWTSFAENGNPNCKEIAPTVWQAVEAGPAHKCLNISNDVTFIDLPETKQFEVWNSFYANTTLY